jgi:hypothetical protein
LLKLRQEKKVLRRGTLTAPLLSTPHVVVLARHWEREFALVAVNNSQQAQTHTFNLPALAHGKEGAVWWGEGVVIRQGTQMTVTVPPMSGWVWGTNSASK